ncbi:zinc finger protein 665-like isoform X1 [Anopheles funestus]|uniref:zinc finger protein 665-like isoform X1 n=2 Tax=Anopheles funestus TaxID=62324 RepID=UPI0020C6C0E3|nr:zinc finger protein 665-like isoform X1 [Anopheles funestus]
MQTSKNCVPLINAISCLQLNMSTEMESTELQHQNSLPCPECEDQLILQQDSTDGKDIDHQVFNCNSCGMRLEIQVEDDLPKNGAEKRFQCDICNRFYATPITLKVHRLLHTTGKTELCDFCGASFQTRGQLKIHRRVHTGEKPYKCNQCDKSFPYRESLITHSTVHTRIKPFLCVVCNSRFSCIGNLLKHRRLRPEKCGLDSIPIRHIGPRPNKKTMPSLSDRQDKEMETKLLQEVPQPNQTTCATDEFVSNKTIDECQIEANTDSTSFKLPTDTDTSAEQGFVKGEEFLEDNEAIDHDRLFLDAEEPNHSIIENGAKFIETTNEANIASDTEYSSPSATSACQNNQRCSSTTPERENSVDKISDNNEKELWEYVNIEPDESSDSSTTAKTPKNGNKRQNKKQTFDSLELFLDEPDEESIQEEQEQLKLLHDLSEPVDSLFRCKLCPQQYTTLYLMARHLERLHNVTLDRARNKLQYVQNTTKHERRYRCNYCDQKYVNPTCLKKHILKHGPDGRLMCKCSCCDEYFMTQEEAHQHALDQHRDRLECEVCQKLFKKPEQVLRHTRYSHSTERKARNKYMCSQCSKKFPSKIALSDHERAECGKSPIYPCDKCDKRFSSFSSLKMHHTVHENQLPFVCSFCGKKFRTKGQQKVHERGHTGEKPYQCDKCTRAFSYRESLVTHQSSHTGVKRYRCMDCDGTFSCTTNLQAHRRVHHRVVNADTERSKSDLKTS